MENACSFLGNFILFQGLIKHLGVHNAKKQTCFCYTQSFGCIDSCTPSTPAPYSRGWKILSRWSHHHRSRCNCAMRPLHSTLPYMIPIILGANIPEKNTSRQRQLPEDDYYLSYDYGATNNSTNDNHLVKLDALILPNPAVPGQDDVLPSVELPDDSLADPDLKDHNCIDDIMYVYYGEKRTSSSLDGPTYYGIVAILFGTVISLSIQLFTLLYVLLMKSYEGRAIGTLIIVVHILLTLFLSNAVFLLGAFATKDLETCLVMAIVSNIFHHHTVFWILSYTMYIYQKFHSSSPITILFKNRMLYIFGAHLILPLITMGTYYTIPNSFETRRFCFKSLERGMIVNFMIPICTQLIITTAFAIRAMIKIENLEANRLDYQLQIDEFDLKNPYCLEKDVKSLKETRKCLKTLCAIQVMFVLNWFLTLVALDASRTSTELPYFQAAASMVLSIFLFSKCTTLMPPIDSLKINRCASLDKYCDNADSTTISMEFSSSPAHSCHHVPLLSCDPGTEMKEFILLSDEKNEDNICTIST
ncbi:hypothetical protein ABEB36_001866 [Hypothenemus hampei]|uniref:G-protein coupled receptors family 2 profile 2 domain-containing protein n=1 Tax=Hypothenemus hampei TaxID=57062 RepID=A0ABD1FFZ5_HYPHA